MISANRAMMALHTDHMAPTAADADEPLITYSRLRCRADENFGTASRAELTALMMLRRTRDT
jgi:hypothetical protein